MKDEIVDLRIAVEKLHKRLEDHGLEVRWAGWLSFIVLCIIAWRVW